MKVVRHGDTKLKPLKAGRIRGVCINCHAVVDAKPEEFAGGRQCSLEKSCLVIDCPECGGNGLHSRKRVGQD